MALHWTLEQQLAQNVSSFNIISLLYFLNQNSYWESILDTQFFSHISGRVSLTSQLWSKYSLECILYTQPNWPRRKSLIFFDYYPISGTIWPFQKIILYLIDNKYLKAQEQQNKNQRTKGEGERGIIDRSEGTVMQITIVSPKDKQGL